MFKIILPKLNFKVERWKWNKEYRIYVSTLGKFKDEYKRNLPIKIENTGYCRVKTICGYKLAHRLVLLTFSPIPNAEELTVDHLNHNKRCNELSNLEWVTKEENLRRAQLDFIQSSNDYIFNIKAGSKIFSNLEEAVDWVIKSQGNNKTVNIPNRNRIKNKIKNAITNQNLYCNRKWRGEIKHD